MSATLIRRGMACWLCWSLGGSALYGQEKSEEPKQSEANRADAAAGDEVRKLKVQLEQAESARAALSAELQKLRQALEAVAKEKRSAEELARQTFERATKEKKSVEERARKQGEEMAAKMREMMAAQAAKGAKGGSPADPSERDDESAVAKGMKFLESQQWETARQDWEAAARGVAADALKQAAERLAQAARQAEGAASKLDEAKPGLSRGNPNDAGEGWQKLIERAHGMLTQTRQNDETAAQFLPKLEEAVRQLRKVGRNDAADDLEAEARVLLGKGRPKKSGDDRRPGDSRAWGDVERAVDELRREVNELRGEVRDLRRSLERGPKADESSRHEPRGDSRDPSRGDARVLVSVKARSAGEVRRFGGGRQPIRVGDRVRKGDALAVLWSKELADQTDKLVDAKKRIHAALTAYKALEAAPEVVPAQRLLDAKRALEADLVALEELKRGVLSWPVDEEVLAERIRELEAGAIEGRATLGEWPLAAPTNGTIVERKLSVGEVVNPEDVLFQIERD